MRHRVAPLEEQFGHVPEAELVPQAPQHGEEHEVRRVLAIVEGRAGPLVEAPSACPAAQPEVAERGAGLALGRRGRAAVRLS